MPSSVDLPNPGTEPKSPTLQADFFFLPSEPPGKPTIQYSVQYIPDNQKMLLQQMAQKELREDI